MSYIILCACLQCGRAMQPNFMFSWPHARMGVASPKHLGKELGDLDSNYTSSAMIHDGIILPSETRKVGAIQSVHLLDYTPHVLQVIAQCLDIMSRYSAARSSVEQTRLPVLRM